MEKSTSVFLGSQFASHSEVEQYVSFIDECNGVPGEIKPGQWYIQTHGDGKPYIWRPINPGAPEPVYAWLPFVDVPKASDIQGLVQLTTEQINNAIANLNIDVTNVANFDANVLNLITQAFVNGDTTQVVKNPDGTLKIEVVPCAVTAKELCDHPIHPGAGTGSAIITLDVLTEILRNQTPTAASDFKASVICIHDPETGLPEPANIGDRYVSAGTANGWVKDSIYQFNGVNWSEETVNEGALVFVECQDILYVYSNNIWQKYVSGITDHEKLTGLLGGDDNGHYHVTLEQASCLAELCAIRDAIVTKAYLDEQLAPYKELVGTRNPDQCLIAQLPNQRYLQARSLEIGGRVMNVRRLFYSESAGSNEWHILSN